MEKLLILLIIFCCVLIRPPQAQATWEDSKEWLEISAEYKDEILEKLRESKEYSAEQLETIQDCLEESSTGEILNCLTDGGVDQAVQVLVTIKDQLGSIRERICGHSVYGNQDKCQRFGDSLSRLKDDFQQAWNSAVEKGWQMLEEKNRLLFMKRKICNSIAQKGCYQWLNERIELKCNPKKIGTDQAVVEKCQLEVAAEVWNRLQQ